MLPPRNLYFPVLPQQINGKLVFETAQRKGGNCVVLARTRTGVSRECGVHQSSFGQFKSVMRLSKCMKCIILIASLHLVTPIMTLLGYIDLFLKIKQESSG